MVAQSHGITIFLISGSSGSIVLLTHPAVGDVESEAVGEDELEDCSQHKVNFKPVLPFQ